MIRNQYYQIPHPAQENIRERDTKLRTASSITQYKRVPKRLAHSLRIAIRLSQPEDYWSCIAHLSAEDMLKSAVIKEKKFKHSPLARADNPLVPNFDVNRKASSLWSFVASLKRISLTSDFIYIFSWFNKSKIQPVNTKIFQTL